VFIPKETDIYPAGFQTFVTVEEVSRTLEGASRPTHFRGVTTIVAKLFNIVQPHVAVFGMKDFQQAVVLRQMARDLGYPIKIIIAPTVREKDGLAMSSRNSRLNDIGRWEALCLFYSLKTAREMVKGSVTSTARIEKEMREVILATCPTAEIDYIAFTDPDTLRPLQKVGRNTVCSLAVKVQGVRLIDNMKLG
jgi:pantoate--beta-alanine ligase